MTVTWAVLESYGVDHQLVRLLRDINENAQAAVRVYGQEGSWFATSRGTKQGDPISPTVFIADIERAMDKVKDGEEGISVHGIKINNLRFANDIDIIAKGKSTLERAVYSKAKLCYNDDYAKQAEKHDGDVHKSRRLTSSQKNNWGVRRQDIINDWGSKI